MTNKERLEANNAKIEEITRTLARKQVVPNDMLQQRVNGDNSCAYLFFMYGGDNLDFISGLDTGNVTTMEYMFNNCSGVTTLDLANFDTSKVTHMNYMFKSCSKLKSVDLSSFNTSNVTRMDYMFNGCSGLTSLDLSSFNTSAVRDMSYMFSVCSGLTSLDLSTFDTSNVTTMSQMFNACSKLTNLNLSGFDTSQVKNIVAMFAACPKLKTLDLSSFNTSNVTDMQRVFNNCDYLTDIVGVIDMIKTTTSTSMFSGCDRLINVTLLNIKKNLKINDTVSLSNATIINTIQQLWDLTGTTSQTLTLSTTSKNNIANIYVKLIDITDEMLAQDEYAGNKKPCVVCEPTEDGAMTLTEYATSKNWAIA